jgi:site-specific recombinase XerD
MTKRTLPREILTDAESDALIEQCDGSRVGLRNRAMLLLLEGTGCRIGETLALEPRDFDWDEEIVNVREGKDGKQRIIPVSPEALVATRTWLDARRRFGIGARAPICCNAKGTSLAKPYVRRMIPTLARKVGILKRVHAHGFRHRFTVRLVRHGVVITSVSYVLGHESVATTHDYCVSIGASHAIDDVRAVLDAEDPSPAKVRS